MFAYEQMNVELVRSAASNTKILLQITEKYILRRTLAPTRQPNNLIPILKGPAKDLKPTAVEHTLLSEAGILSTGDLSYWSSVEINDIKYTSFIYRKTKSINYFVQFSDGQLGMIKYFVKCNSVFAVVDLFHIIKTKNHLKEVEPKKIVAVFKIEDLEDKLKYMEIGLKHIVSRIPNNYEKT